jgi:hypothetical protein
MKTKESNNKPAVVCRMAVNRKGGKCNTAIRKAR